MTTATAVRERPMLFSAPMVLALLAGKKTQTRRILKTQPSVQIETGGWPIEIARLESGDWGVCCQGVVHQCVGRCPYGRPGERLWVKETFHYDNAAYVSKYKDAPWLGMPDAGNAQTYYRASEKNPDIFPRWKPSIFMPRWASRITLEITEVRAQRLQDISEEDAIAEGVKTLPNSYWYPTWARTFCHLWNDINPDNGCEKNPHVWAITFKRISP